MTLASTARIRLNPRSILQHREAHDLAHLLVRARRSASPAPASASRRTRPRRYRSS